MFIVVSKYSRTGNFTIILDYNNTAYVHVPEMKLVGTYLSFSYFVFYTFNDFCNNIKAIDHVSIL